MEKYFKRKFSSTEEASTSTNSDDNLKVKISRHDETVNLDELPSDPGLRKKISEYTVNDQDKIRRIYLQRGPCQPREHSFPQTIFGGKLRRFNPIWFEEHKNWLEYSIAKDAAFCLYCYLYRPDIGDQASGDSFDVRGFRNWKKKERFNIHIGQVNSAHNLARIKCEALMNQDAHITFAFSKPSDQARNDYRARLSASVDCVRFLLKQGLAFRGHDESEDSENQGNFLELLHFLADHNDNIKKIVLANAPGNNKLIAPDIQKDIAHAGAIETSNAIMKGLNNDYFAILLDESRDISTKEQVSIAIRYVNKSGCIIEHFLGIIHVGDTSAATLKLAMETIFSNHSLCISQLRGQGYDGASNMRGEFNGLKSLILKENSSAHYIHCFAHQLQLALVAVAKNQVQIASFFNIISSLITVVGGSCKRRELLYEKQLDKVIEQLSCEEIKNGIGLHQEISLQRPGDTRWGSHYRALVSIIGLFKPIIDVLEIILEDGLSSEQKGEALTLLDSIQTFNFVFNLYLMKVILGITNELSQSLQRKDQDIINAMTLVKVSKQRLQDLRDNGWDNIIEEVSLLCSRNNIDIPNMSDNYVIRGRSRRNVEKCTNLHHYQVEIFYSVIDMQLQELNNRFDEANTELLLCVACLNPCNLFSAFDKHRLIHLAKYYPMDFSQLDLIILEDQLETYIYDMKSNESFIKLKGTDDLAQKLVETKKSEVYPLVYRLLKLALILPITTATVERAFSAMKIVKNRLRNRMGDSWMNDCLVTYIEKEIFNSIDNEVILQRFQNMKPRREKF